MSTTEQPGGEAPVRFIEHQTAGGHLLVQAELNSESTLNALSLPMIDLLRPALAALASRDDVAAVVFTGAGSKAFCAGGDIQALYHAICRNHAAGKVVDTYPFEFFEREYRLDYQIHNYPKPVVALGHGIVMGGGLGIFSGAAIQLVTERSRIAIPEVGIGLFPDAGATWMLRNAPVHYALFAGLSGSHLNAADARLLGLGAHSVPSAQLDQVLPALIGLKFSGDPAADADVIRAALDALPDADLPDSELQRVPDRLTLAEDLAGTVAGMRALAGTSEWIDKGIAGMNRGCPATVGIVVEQIRRAGALSMAECFRLEYNVASHCAEFPDFAEGVRALLIDKDGAPKWRYPDVESLDLNYVAEHFEPPSGPHPLADLETSS